MADPAGVYVARDDGYWWSGTHKGAAWNGGTGNATTYFGASLGGYSHTGEESRPEAFIRISNSWDIDVVRYWRSNDASPYTWPLDASIGGNYPVIISTSGTSPTSVLNGNHDAGYQAMFQNAPTDRPIWWCYYHEPEDNIGDGAFTIKQWQDATNYVGAIAKQYAPPNMRHTLIMIAGCFLPNGNWLGITADQYLGGIDWNVVDVLGFDGYQSDNDYMPDAQSVIGNGADYAASLGVPWGVCELGSWSTKTDHERAEFLRGCIDIIDQAATPCEMAAYYEVAWSSSVNAVWELLGPWPGCDGFPEAAGVWAGACARMTAGVRRER
ncbi:MAG: hypothetical protein ACRDQA_03105 [Nocardioidaceae bacterium]